MAGSSDNGCCEYCSGKLAKRRVRAPFWFRKTMIFVDRAPAWVCGRCGAMEFEARVYEKLEQIARRRERIKATVTFPLADFQKAA